MPEKKFSDSSDASRGTNHDPMDPTQWVDQFGDALFAFAVARTGDRSVAEDLVQDTFLAAVSRRGDFRSDSHVSTWLFAIMKRKVVDHFRKIERRRKNEQVERKVDSPAEFAGSKSWEGDPSRVFQNQEFWETFDRCVEKLPDRLAEVFILREINQTSPKEIRELLGINATNLSMRLHRCRQSLRECLDRHWFERQ